MTDEAIPFAEAKSLMADYISGYKPSKSIVRFEIRIKPIDQIAWLEAQANPIKVFGENADNTAAIAGIGAAVILKGQKLASFDSVIKKLRAYLSPQYPYLQWYGGFAFDGKSSTPWSDFGAWQFVLPQIELARNGNKMMLACNLIGKINTSILIKRVNQLTLGGDLSKKPLAPIITRVDSPNKLSWIKSVRTVLKSIVSAQGKKVVLARRTNLTFKEKINPWVIFRQLIKTAPLSYHFVFQFNAKTFLGASPERLYQRQGNKLVSQALAGTKSRQVKPKVLLNSSKDRHEHELVVQAIRQALSPLASSVKFQTTPDVLTLTSGHHLNTPFHVDLNNGVSDGAILQSLHPTPALGGEPRAFALGQIKSLEPFERGWYGGPIGYVGLDWAEFVVAIRSGLVEGNKLSLYAGAGIVDGSDPAEEWDEVENKISNFQKIII